MKRFFQLVVGLGKVMSKRSKNHHFVPKVLQKQFATESGGIWYSKRSDDLPPEKNFFEAPVLRNIGTTFRIRDYYTVGEGDGRSDIIEKKFYGDIDNYLGRVLPNILKMLENSKIPTFSGDALDSLTKVVLEMSKRTPDFTKHTDDIETGREIANSMLTALKDRSESADYIYALKALENPNKLKEMGRSVRVRGTILPSQKIEAALKDFSVRWAVSETHHSYILSSTMVYRIGNGGPNGISNPNMEFWMPVSPKVALVLVRDKNKKIPFKVVDTPDHIRKVNEYAMKNSRNIASHSEQLLISLTNK